MSKRALLVVAVAVVVALVGAGWVAFRGSPRAEPYEWPSTVPTAVPLAAAPSGIGPAPGQSPRAFVRAELVAQIADGRSMGDVRDRAFGGGARIDEAAIAEKVARQNAHFARSAEITAYLQDTALPQTAEDESAILHELGAGEEDDPTDEEIDRAFADPRVRELESQHAWLFGSFRAIEAARLCGDGERHAAALVHCADAERAIQDLDRETAEEYGPLSD